MHKPIIGLVIPLTGLYGKLASVGSKASGKTVIEPGILPFPETEIPAGETVTIRTAVPVGQTFRLRRLSFATEASNLIAWLFVTDIRIGNNSTFLAQGRIRATELRGFKTEWGSPAMHALVTVQNENQEHSATVRLHADVEIKREGL